MNVWSTYEHPVLQCDQYVVSHQRVASDILPLSFVQ